MEIHVIREPLEGVRAEALVLPLLDEQAPSQGLLAPVDAALEGVFSRLVGEQRFKARLGEVELVHTLDKEIARLSGVSLKGDIKHVNLTVDRARDYIDEVMAVVFDVVEDEYIQDRIIAGLAELDGDH